MSPINMRESINNIFAFKSSNYLPIVHFGFWQETLEKWRHEGYVSKELAEQWTDGTAIDIEIGKKLGFDFNWMNCFFPDSGLRPVFEERVIEKTPDGEIVLNSNGAMVLRKPGVVSIPMEVDHILKDRASWEEHFLPRLRYCQERVTAAKVNTGTNMFNFVGEGIDFLKADDRTMPVGLFCGSLLGLTRNWLGLEGLSFLLYDDERLFDEITETVADVSYKCIEATLQAGARFDFGHFWEDVCCKNGPLINPRIFASKIGPHYGRITKLLKDAGIRHFSVDCDGVIDELVHVWVENDITIMFPIEVGTWDGSIVNLRKKFGAGIKGVGGVNKAVFAQDYAAIDAEIERLRSMVEQGGYIPCPDHRLPPEAVWANVQYYCDRMRKTFCS